MNKKTNNNLLIYQKYMDLIYYSNDIVRKYPKSERFALVEEIKHTIYAGLRMLIHAIKSYAIPEKMKYLKELGCEFVQGYYYFKPLNKGEFMKLF